MLVEEKRKGNFFIMTIFINVSCWSVVGSYVVHEHNVLLC